MKVETVDFSETECFSPIFLDFISKKEVLKPFYHHPPTPEHFKEQISEKHFSEAQRDTLVKALEEQYGALSEHPVVSKQIASLGDKKTFTITTGHQLNIFTGPLYFHFKIITVINACKALNEQYPEYHFVPIYWMASEDHDLEEIQSIRVDGEKLKWETDQTGAVGKMQPNGLADMAHTLGVPTFEKAYKEADTLAEAVRKYAHALYADEGLVVVDGDHPKLKAQFSAVIKDDITQNIANDLVESASGELARLGYKSQTFPREINFFYLKDNIRSRIVKEDDQYSVLDTNISFSSEEIDKEIDEHPERFSPNVILRPLYQEQILPNLAYTGGPAEVAYWLQLKEVFNHYQTTFPILLPRNFGLVIPNRIQHKIGKLKLTSSELFTETEQLKKNITKKFSPQKLYLNEERLSIKKLLDDIKQQANEVDPSLAQMTEAETQKTLNSFEKIEKKMMAAEKRKYADKMRQIDEIKGFLFPGNGLQERKDNIIPFLKADKNFIQKLLKSFNPFDLKFHIIRWDG